MIKLFLIVVPFRPGGDVELGKANTIKEGRQRLRWNLLFNLMLWAIIPIPIWLPFVSMDVSYWVLPGKLV